MQEITSWDDSVWGELGYDDEDTEMAYALTDHLENVVYVGQTTQEDKKSRLKEWFQSQSATGITLVNTADITEVHIWTVNSGNSKDAEKELHNRFDPPCSSPTKKADGSNVDLDDVPKYVFKPPSRHDRDELPPQHQAVQTLNHISKLIDTSQVRLSSQEGRIDHRIGLIQDSIEYYLEVAEEYSVESLHQHKQ